MLLKKSLEMFNLSKSREDLQDKTSVQHKVLCDWLRNIQQQNINLSRKITALQKSIDLLTEDESLAGSMEIPDGDSTGTEPIR